MVSYSAASCAPDPPGVLLGGDGLVGRQLRADVGEHAREHHPGRYRSGVSVGASTAVMVQWLPLRTHPRPTRSEWSLQRVVTVSPADASVPSCKRVSVRASE